MDQSNSVNKPVKPSFFSPVFLIILAVLLLAGTALTFFIAQNPNRNRTSGSPNPFGHDKSEFKKFASEAEFREFLQKSRTGDASFGGMAPTAMLRADSMQADNKATMSFGLGSGTAERASTTNVQVLGIDEPDMVKNNDKHIFYAQQGYFNIGRPEPMLMQQNKMIAPDYQTQQKVQIINAFPAETMAKIGSIDKTGDLLLQDNILIVLAGQTVYGFDVSNPAAPQEKWKIDIKDENYLAQSRLYNDKLYLVLQKGINSATPCPLRPIAMQGQDITIPCGEIYHPAPSISADATYTALKINPADGTTEKSIAFIGSNGGSTIYMSKNALYIAFANQPDTLAFVSNFVEEKAADLIPDDVRARIKRLQSYDISYAAKMTEVNQLMQTYFYGQSSDDQLKKQTELQNRLKQYATDHKRDISSTQIVRLDANELTQTALTTIPGTLLNQFSLDEHNDNLRVAVTVGGFAWMAQGETANDLYVLSKELRMRGQIKDMGVTERIYSARFMEDKGYLVTFKQTDPFYVLDLSNPDNPQIKGELKIPGFSSYLHPLKNNLLVGIGREESNLKASLFDVSDPTNPKEISKYQFKDYGSEVMYNHHAFLNDPKHEIFFVPGSEGGYVISYKDNNLTLTKAIAKIAPQRALYMNDNLYVIGNDEIVVYNETTWNEVKRLKLERDAITTTPSPVPEQPLDGEKPQTLPVQLR